MATDASQLAEWISLARQGDDLARNRLFAACRSFVALAARLHLDKRLQAKVDPSDLVQQSLLEAHNAFEEFRGETPAEWLAWLKRVVHHNAADLHRHYGRAGKRDLRKEVAPLQDALTTIIPAGYAVDRSPSPSQHLVAVERSLDLAQAIEQLPEDYREILLLRHVQRLPFDEVAQKMRRTRGACQMLWMRAIYQLRATLPPESSVR